MPLYQHDQTNVGNKACGASCIMCAAKELNAYDGVINDAEADTIYRRIWRGPNDESLISRIAGVLGGFRLTAEIIEDRSKTGRQGFLRQDAMMSTVFEPAYQAYKADIKNVVPRNKRPGPGAFLATDFDRFARLMIVVALSTGLTHWVLARRWQNSISVMNPDGGTETTEADLVNWLNAPVGTVRQIGTVDYTFTGIVLSVTRTDRGG